MSANFGESISGMTRGDMTGDRAAPVSCHEKKGAKNSI